MITAYIDDVLFSILLINKVYPYWSFVLVLTVYPIYGICEVIKQNYQYTNDYNTNLDTSLVC